MHGGEEVVFAARQHIVVEGHAGSDELGYAALDQFLCQLGVFELFADGHTLAGTHEFGQIGIEGVMRKSGQLYILRHAVGTPRQGDAEYFRCLNSVVAESFIEIAHAEEQYCVGMLCLHLGILLHQRRLYNLFGHSLLRLKVEV